MATGFGQTRRTAEGSICSWLALVALVAICGLLMVAWFVAGLLATPAHASSELVESAAGLEVTPAVTVNLVVGNNHITATLQSGETLIMVAPTGATAYIIFGVMSPPLGTSCPITATGMTVDWWYRHFATSADPGDCVTLLYSSNWQGVATLEVGGNVPHHMDLQIVVTTPFVTNLVSGANHISKTLEANQTWEWRMPSSFSGGRLYLDGGFVAGGALYTPTIKVDGAIWQIEWDCVSIHGVCSFPRQFFYSAAVSRSSQVEITAPGNSPHYGEFKLRLLYQILLPIVFR